LVWSPPFIHISLLSLIYFGVVSSLLSPFWKEKKNYFNLKPFVNLIFPRVWWKNKNWRQFHRKIYTCGFLSWAKASLDSCATLILLLNIEKSWLW
jgi:hypothetical protein